MSKVPFKCVFLYTYNYLCYNVIVMILFLGTLCYVNSFLLFPFLGISVRLEGVVCWSRAGVGGAQLPVIKSSPGV